MYLLSAAQFREKHMSGGAKLSQVFFPAMDDPVFVRETATYMARLTGE